MRFFPLIFIFFFTAPSWATLILLQPTINGFVVCGDHRLSDPLGGSTRNDTTEKVFPFRNGINFNLQETLLGNPQYGILSMNDETRHFFASHVITHESIATFSQQYQTKLETLVNQDSHLRDRMNFHYVPNDPNPFVEAVFLFQQGNHLHLTFTYWKYFPNNSFPHRFLNQIQDQPDASLQNNTALAFGNSHLVRALLQGDLRVADLSRDPKLVRVLPLPGHIPNSFPSISEADSSLRILMRATSERFQQIFGMPPGVSPTATCCFVPIQGPIRKLHE